MKNQFLPKQGSSDRSFGIVFFIFFLIVALLPLFRGYGFRYWALYLSIAFLTLAFLKPKILSPLNRFWTVLGLLLQQLTSPIVLAILFYFVLTPTGLLMRLFGKHSFQLKFEPYAKSYWIRRNPPGSSTESFKNQF
jgi:hypothetical protein